MTKKELTEWGLSEEQAQKVLDGLKDGYAAKSLLEETRAELDQTKQALKERDGQLDILKKSSGDAETMKKQIADLQAANQSQKEQHAAELKSLRIGNAVELALAGAKAKNHIAAKALLADFLSKAELDEAGTVKGLAEEMKKLTTGKDTAFLFDTAPAAGFAPSGFGFRGVKPGGTGSIPPAGDDPKKMSYEQLCDYLDLHPGAKLE